MKIKWFFFCTLLLSACGHSDNTITINTKDNSADVGLIDPKKVDKFFSDVFDEVKFIPLESSKQSYLSFVNDVLFFKGNYFIKDNTQQCIFCFDEQGKFKFKIFPRGKGPLELNGITDFTINTGQSTLEVFDFSLGKIVSFDLSGNPLSEKRFNYYLREFSRESNGDYVVYAPDLLNDKTADKIAPGAFVTDSTGKYKYSFLVTHTVGNYVQPINCLSGYGDSITLVSNYSKDVFLINNDKISKIFRLQYSQDWTQSLITSNASGGRVNISYRKDVTDNTGNPVYLNVADHSQLYFNRMFNNLFVMPVIIPYFYKDSETMIGFMTALDLKNLNDYLKRAVGLKVDQQLVDQLQAIAKTLTENDNPVMITMHLKH
jgi:6-bladed beta-propeller